VLEIVREIICAIAQAVRHQFVTMKMWIQIKGSPFGIYDKESDWHWCRFLCEYFGFVLPGSISSVSHISVIVSYWAGAEANA
jgi:hypothetical protein